MGFILGLIIGIAAGLMIAVLSPSLWHKWTTKAAAELDKPAP